jgi:hypothetical protein
MAARSSDQPILQDDDDNTGEEEKEVDADRITDVDDGLLHFPVHLVDVDHNELEKYEDARHMMVSYARPDDDDEKGWATICMLTSKDCVRLKDSVGPLCDTWRKYYAYYTNCDKAWSTLNVVAQTFKPPAPTDRSEYEIPEQDKDKFAPIGVTANFAFIRNTRTDEIYICYTNVLSFVYLKWVRLGSILFPAGDRIVYAKTGHQDTFIVLTKGNVPTIYVFSVDKNDGNTTCVFERKFVSDPENFPDTFIMDSDKEYFAYVPRKAARAGLVLVKMSTFKCLPVDTGKYTITSIGFGDNYGHRLSWYRKESKHTVRFENIEFYATKQARCVSLCHWTTAEQEVKHKLKKSRHPRCEDVQFFVNPSMHTFCQVSAHNIYAFQTGIHPSMICLDQLAVHKNFDPNDKSIPVSTNFHYHDMENIFDISIMGSLMFALMRNTGTLWVYRLTTQKLLVGGAVTTDNENDQPGDRSLFVPHYPAIYASVGHIVILYPNGNLSFLEPKF